MRVGPNFAPTPDVSFFLSLLTFVLVAYHLRIRKFPGVRAIVAYCIATTAVAAFWSGFFLAMQEDARSRYGQTTEGVVVEKISSLGLQGARTIGRRHSDIVTSNGTRAYDMLARQIVSGSPAAWVIDYSYACSRPQPCWGRDFVTRQMWFGLQAGAPVKVRYLADGLGAGARLESNRMMDIAIAEMMIGVVVALIAAGVGGLLPSLVRRARRLETTAIVTSVERVQFLGMPRFRVRFAYLDHLGGSRQGMDHFATDSWKPGDVGAAVYEVANPDDVTLEQRPVESRR